MSEVTLKIVIKGRVQGVGYRYFTKRRADELGITGHVKNNADGSVEIQARGEDAKMQQFLHKLKQGPENASVKKLDITETQKINYILKSDRFHIRY